MTRQSAPNQFTPVFGRHNLFQFPVDLQCFRLNNIVTKLCKHANAICNATIKIGIILIKIYIQREYGTWMFTNNMELIPISIDAFPNDCNLTNNYWLYLTMWIHIWAENDGLLTKRKKKRSVFKLNICSEWIIITRGCESAYPNYRMSHLRACNAFQLINYEMGFRYYPCDPMISI